MRNRPGREEIPAPGVPGSVWGKIHVLEGRLRYVVDGRGADVVLTPDAPGIVVPDVLHHIEPHGAVRFLVEFQAAPAISGNQS